MRQPDGYCGCEACRTRREEDEADAQEEIESILRRSRQKIVLPEDARFDAGRMEGEET